MKLVEARVVKPPTVLESERQVIIGEEGQTEILEEPDLLADQRDAVPRLGKCARR